jgi:hypothetical protein
MLVLGLAALALNLAGCWWGLPRITGPSAPPHGWEMDTTSGLATLSEIHNLLYPKADWYVAYPLFHYLVQGMVYAPYLAYLLLTGQFVNPSGTYPFGLKDPSGAIANLVLISHLLSVLMSMVVIGGVYWIGKRVWDRTTGLLAACALLLSPLFQYYSRTSNLDMPVLFWTVLGLAGIAAAVTERLTARRAVWIGVMAALAVATKDQGYAAWVGGLFALAGVHWRQSAASLALGAPFWKPLLALGASGASCYLLASGLLIWPNRFLAHFAFVRDFRKTFFNVVHLDLMRPQSLAGYAHLTFDIADCAFEAVGPALLLLAIGGCIVLWKQSAFTRILIVMMTGHLVLTIFPIRHMMFRYVLFVAMGLTLVGARSLILLWRAGGIKREAAGVLGATAYLWLAVFGAEVTYQMWKDARFEASEWIAQNFQPGERAGFFGSPDQLPHIPAGVTVIRAPVDLPPDWLETNQFDWVFVIPDFSSRSNGAAAPFCEKGLPRSHFLPEQVYQRVLDGSLGYRLAARFETPSLTGRPLKFLPWINPPVRIFRRSTAAANPKTLGVKATEWETKAALYGEAARDRRRLLQCGNTFASLSR